MADTAQTPAIQAEDRPPWAWIVDHFDLRLKALGKVGGNRNPGYAQAEVNALVADMRQAIIENAQGLIAQKHGKERAARGLQQAQERLADAIGENRALRERLADEKPAGPPTMAVRAVMDGQRLAERTLDLAAGAVDLERPESTNNIAKDLLATVRWLPQAIDSADRRVHDLEAALPVARQILGGLRSERAQLTEVLPIARAELNGGALEVTEADQVPVIEAAEEREAS